jgi:hypothetical protein
MPSLMPYLLGVQFPPERLVRRILNSWSFSGVSRKRARFIAVVLMKPRVLIVDDESAIRLLVKDAARKGGIERLKPLMPRLCVNCSWVAPDVILLDLKTARRRRARSPPQN